MSKFMSVKRYNLGHLNIGLLIINHLGSGVGTNRKHWNCRKKLKSELLGTNTSQSLTGEYL